MLKKILSIQNVGLLQNATPTPVALEAVTLIYVENGRGKTTLARALRGCAGLRSQDIDGMRTLDSASEPALEMLFEIDGTNIQNKLSGGSWSGSEARLQVFDTTFVEENVYAGDVSPQQRQSLLKFAIGNQAVALEKQIGDLTQQISSATRAWTLSKGSIAAFARNTTAEQLIAVQDVPDAEAQIAALRERLESAKNVEPLLRRESPEEIGQIAMDLGSFFGILRSTVADIQVDAREIVSKHFQAHGQTAGFEQWVSRGRSYANPNECPYCGQDVAGLTLVDAYNVYFNTVYDEFMANVRVLSAGVQHRLAEARAVTIESTARSNQSKLIAWQDRIDLTLPPFNVEHVRSLLNAMRGAAAALAARKETTPLESVGTDDEMAALSKSLSDIQETVSKYNGEIRERISSIQQYKDGLARELPDAISSQIARLELVIARRSEKAIELISAYEKADQVRKDLIKKKDECREQLEKLLPDILKEYQTKINTLLGAFGVDFTIVELDSAFRGGVLRSEYGLAMRGKVIELDGRGHARPCFSNALSEADKRTLALAFFLAKLEGTTSLSDQTIVLDDPVSSFDANRRARTIEKIIGLAQRNAQLIVLSHDPHFLSDILEQCEGPGCKINPKTFQLKRGGAKGYSEITGCNVQRVCERPYFRRHRITRELLSGSYPGPARDVGTELRTLVEGYYHLKFPAPILPARANLGAIIGEIDRASAESPLQVAKPYVKKLNALNTFVKRFHHDDGYSGPEPTDDETEQHARMALEIIYGDHTHA